jgi:hypothetical protein
MSMACIDAAGRPGLYPAMTSIRILSGLYYAPLP